MADAPRALVVEDEFIIAMEIEMLLGDFGVEVVGMAATADEAVKLAERERPNFVTMDINLAGGRNGISAAIEIYEKFGIRPIFISAYDDENFRQRGQSAHPHAWVGKPISPVALQRAVRQTGSEGPEAAGGD